MVGWKFVKFEFQVDSRPSFQLLDGLVVTRSLLFYSCAYALVNLQCVSFSSNSVCSTSTDLPSLNCWSKRALMSWWTNIKFLLFSLMMFHMWQRLTTVSSRFLIFKEVKTTATKTYAFVSKTANLKKHLTTSEQTCHDIVFKRFFKNR